MLARILDAVIFGGAGVGQVSTWLWLLLPVFAIRATLAWLAERSAVIGATQALGSSFTTGERTGALTETLTRGIEDLTEG